MNISVIQAGHIIRYFIGWNRLHAISWQSPVRRPPPSHPMHPAVEPMATTATVMAASPLKKADMDDLDNVLDTLAKGKAQWAALGVAGRLPYLRALKKNLSRADFLSWSSGCVELQGLDASSPNGAAQACAEMFVLSSVITSELTRLDESLSQLAKSGSLPVDAPLVRQPGAKGGLEPAEEEPRVVTTFPSGFRDKYMNPLGLLGFRSDLHLGATTSRGTQALAADRDGGTLYAVLGAGNQDFLSIVDCLDKLFVHGAAVAFKHHPVRAHQHPHFEALFRPLIEIGAFASLCGGASLGARLVAHASIDKIHLTGGSATHEAIIKATKKPMTSELGCVTPWLLVPPGDGVAAWSAADVTHHAMQLANGVIAQSSCNCLSPKVLVLSKHCETSKAFVKEFKSSLSQIPAPPPYYPGTANRYADFRDAYEGRASTIVSPLSTGVASNAVERFGAPLPTLLVELNAEACGANEMVLTREAFAPVFAIVWVDCAAEPAAYLDKAVPFCNERIWGNLSCTMLVHTATHKAHEAAVERGIAQINYGCVCVNAWSALGYTMETAAWGGHQPSNAVKVSSGMGLIRNCKLYDNVEKSVVRTPFKCAAHLSSNPKELSATPRAMRIVASVARWLAWF